MITPHTSPLTTRAFSDPGVPLNVARGPPTSPSLLSFPTRKRQAKKSPALSHANKADKLESALAAIRSVLDRTSTQCTIDNVSVQFYEELDASVRARSDFVGWEETRVDLRNGRLIVGYPMSVGHEIMTDIFTLLSQNGGWYPHRPHGGSTIMSGGTSDVKLKDGIKSPDFSLYEMHSLSSTSSKESHQLNSYPTIAWEVAYSEPEKKLYLDAARMICLSHGLIQLVVTINITHEKNRTLEDGDTPKLKQVNCAFWELDIVNSREIECDDADDSKLDKSVPERNEDYPSAYSMILAAVVPGSKRLRVRAERTEIRELFPTLEAEDMNILFRHLYREPEVGEDDKIALCIRTADIMKVINDHEAVMRSQAHIKQDPPNLNTLADTLRRKKARKDVA